MLMRLLRRIERRWYQDKNGIWHISFIAYHKECIPRCQVLSVFSWRDKLKYTTPKVNICHKCFDLRRRHKA